MEKMQKLIIIYVLVCVTFLVGCASLPSFFKAADAVVKEETILIEAAESVDK